MSSNLKGLLTSVECANLYEFLKLDSNATPEELRAAAQKEFDRIHSKGRRGGRWDARKELTGLCKSIFRDNRTKKEYDRTLEEAAGRDAGANEDGEPRRGEASGVFDETSEILRAGWGLIAQGRTVEAVAIAKRLDGTHRECSRFRAAVGELLVNGNQLAEAIEFLDWCEVREPDNREYRTLLGIAFAKAGTATWDDFGSGPCATRADQVAEAEACLLRAGEYAAGDAAVDQELANLRTHIDFAKRTKWNGNEIAVFGGVSLGMLLMAVYVGLIYWLSTALYVASCWEPQWRRNADTVRGGTAGGDPIRYLFVGGFTALFMPFVAVSRFRWGTLGEWGALRDGPLSWWKAQNRVFRVLLVVLGVLLLLDLAGRPFRGGSGSAIPETASGAGTVTGPEGGANGGTATDDSFREVEDSLELSESARRRIQRGLAIAGFDPGPVDGVFGSRTRAALGEWQSSVGVSSTGFLIATDAELLQALARDVGEPVEGGDTVVAEASEQAPVPSGGRTSVEPVASVPASAPALAGRWFGRIEGFGRRYYVDIFFEEDGARVRYPLSGCSGRLRLISGSSYREEVAEGDDCLVNGRVTLRRLTVERVSYQWGYDSRSVEASGQLLRVAAMAEGGDASALSGIWSGEHGYTRYPSNEYSAELTIEPTGVVFRISWPCVFRLEPVSADSQRLVFRLALLEGFCIDDARLMVRRLGRDALWWETSRDPYYGTMVGILNRGFE